MTIINGANNHNVEELLSSIRNDTGPLRAGPSSPFARRDTGAHEDTSEFELPAIFKPGHAASTEKSHNLFGRLSDALKPASTEPDRSRTVIRFEPANGRMIEPPPAMTAAQAPKPKPMPVAEPAAPVIAENSTVKREMPSFFDTRLNKLGEMSRKSGAPMPVEPPRSAPQAVAPQALVPQPPPLRPQAPPLTEAGGAMEDAAAQLLRPILKQWLMENMPKIVEKALRSEAGDDFSQQSPPADGRKPGQ
jgi:cell pole-organizing protein PopZ